MPLLYHQMMNNLTWDSSRNPEGDEEIQGGGCVSS